MRRFKHIQKSAIGIFVVMLGSLFGTTVVVVRTPKRIILAADSMQFAGKTRQRACKIGTNPAYPISFAFAGNVADNRGFSAIGLAEAAVSTNASIEDVASRFQQSTTPKFRKFLIEMRREKPSDFRELLKKPEPLQFVFANFNNGNPKFIVVVFKVDEINHIIHVTPEQRSCPGEACQKGNGMDILGENGAIRKAQNINPNFLIGLDPVAGTRKMVQMEIDDRPDIVGPPISYVTIDASGTHWGEKGECR